MKQKQIVLALLLAFGSAAAHAASGTVAVSPEAPWQDAQATSDFAIAIGNDAVAGTTISGGTPALVITPSWSYPNQVSIGASSISWGAGDVAIGSGSVAASQPSPGVTSSATSIGNGAASWGTNNVSLGFHALAGATNPGAPTSNPTISNATALGGQSSVQASNGTAVGAQASVLPTATNAVALGAGTVATQANTVEVGGRRLTGLNDAIAGTDGVTLNQLNAAIIGVGGIDPTAILNQANGYTDQQIAGLRREYSRAIAAVAASPTLPALAPGERAFAVGGGFYNGQQSIGIAYGQALSNISMVNAGISTAGGGMVVAKVGASWKF